MYGYSGPNFTTFYQHEAAKDILDLMKLLEICPENVTVQSLSFTNEQQVRGNCELFIYDIDLQRMSSSFS